MRQPVAIGDDGLAMYVLTTDQVDRFATLRAALPRLEVNLDAVLAVG